jgi:transcriptional regulator with XRE-family HTH domain
MERSPSPRDIGRRAKAFRRAAGLTQSVVARRSEIHVTNLSKLENGKAPNPNMNTLSRLARALRVPVTALLSSSKG